VATAADGDLVIVTASVAGDAVPGGVLTATATVEILDGSTLLSHAWMQTSGVEATLEGADTPSATVTLASRSAFKEALIHILKEPPVGEEELPPNVPLPEGEFPGGLQDRFQVVGVDPFSLEETGLVTLKVTVTTSSGSYADEVDVHTELPWKVAGGIRDVPLGNPVLLHGKDQVSESSGYAWTLAAPAGSSAILVDPATQNPDFTPDVTGMYAATESETGNTIEVYAGTWRGVIVGQDEDGRPVADSSCTGCHNASGAPAPDMFTPWAQTGHAEIFTNNLNTSTHYGENCFGCHMVGFDPEAANGGVDEAPDYDDFLAAGLLNNPGDNWTTVLAEFPDTAQLANIQCENCHGPQDIDIHSFDPEDPAHLARVDLSSNVCGTCHGEPLRHARFQQWQLSGHANYELAIDEGSSGNCSRCHSGNGFLTWLPALLDDDPANNGDSVTVTWTEDETHPQTCATCHDPHNIGTTTGINTNATVRISDNTPLLLAGFRALGVGRGAMCMTCHNSRRGLRNDDTFEATKAAGDAARAPHGSVQTDLLMGENAYLVDLNLLGPGKHSLLTDTCVDCHMEKTPPPDVLSYNQGGTNHTFFASKEVCSSCHGEGISAEGVQARVQATLDVLQTLQEDAIRTLIAELTLNLPRGLEKKGDSLPGGWSKDGKSVSKGNTIDLGGQALIADVWQIVDLEFGETRGRQAITVTLTDGSTIGPVRMSDIDVLDPRDKVMGELYDFADDRVIKAGWNWNLVNNDSSRGLHNPSFSLQVLEAGIDALTSLFLE
jgi:hypothetical protein